MTLAAPHAARALVARALTLVLPLTFFACSGESGSLGTEPASHPLAARGGKVGTLVVAISGVPAGAAAAVTVTGPAGYTNQLTQSATLTGVRAGSYTVVAASISPGGSTYTAAPSSQTVDVPAGGTGSAAVTYSAPTSPTPTPTTPPPTDTPGAVNLRIDGTYLTQGVQTYGRGVPLVAGRDGILRVFAVASAANSVAPTVRVRLYQNGALISTLTAQAGSSSVPTTISEGTYSSSWNASVPGALIQPGLAVLADVDPANVVAESDEADNQFPTAGTPLALDVRTLPSAAFRFVPVFESATGRQGYVSDGNKEDFLRDTRRMLPVADVNSDVRAAYTTTQVLSSNGAGWAEVLNELATLRVADASARHYYGVVKVGYSSGVAGIGYIGWPAALGWDYQPSAGGVAAHEIGHNWGRSHSPCGGVADADPSYPYSGGVTGAWGLDVSTATTHQPTEYDLMGYCGPKWISDFTYRGMLDFRASQGGGSAYMASGTTEASLVVWGRITAGGEMLLEPAFDAVARPSLPRGGGRYTLEGRDGGGARLFAISFDGEVVSEGAAAGDRHFAFAVPMSEEARDRLATLRLSGGGRSAVQRAGGAVAEDAPDIALDAEGSDHVRIRWDRGRYPLVVVRDPATGDILSLAKGGSAVIRAARSDLDLTVSDGVRSTTRRALVRGR